MTKFLIQDLVDDLKPVRAIRPFRPVATSMAITGIALAMVVFFLGPREDILAGRPDPMFLLRSGILLLLGFANAYAAINMASPAVGRHNESWQIAVAAALLFPLAAMIVAISAGVTNAVDAAQNGMECLQMSLVGGLATAIPMVLHLRRGAPTSPERAGWLTGIASGGLGAFAYNFHCPFNDLIYTGIWYTLAVGVCAVMGRLLVPRLIRW
jgi:hypothetical protein